MYSRTPSQVLHSSKPANNSALKEHKIFPMIFVSDSLFTMNFTQTALIEYFLTVTSKSQLICNDSILNDIATQLKRQQQKKKQKLI